MKLLDEVNYINPIDLKEAFDSGVWQFCRKEFYIRQSVDHDSVDEKKEALLCDIKEGSGVIRVIEPFAVNIIIKEDGSQVYEVISGNTRLRAIIELLSTNPCVVTLRGGGKDATINVTSIEPIPYRLFENPITLEDAIQFQTSTNDFTKRHNPLDIAIKVFELKPTLEQQFIEQGIKKREAQAKATAHLCGMFRKTQQNISQYTNVLSKASNYMKKLLHDTVISIDSALTITQKLGDSSTHEQIDKILSELIQQSKTLYASANNISADKVADSDVSISKGQVVDYLKNLAEKQSANSDDADTSETKVESGFPANKTSSSSPASSTSEKGKTVTRDIFLEDTQNVVSRVYLIDASKLKKENAKQVSELSQGMLESIFKVMPLMDTEKSLENFEAIKQVYMNVCGDPESLAKKIGENEQGEFAAYLKLYSKISKPSEALKKALYETDEKPEVEQQPAKADAEVIEMIETDEHLVTVTA